MRTVEVLEVLQSFGETMLLHDAASRAYDAVVNDTCAAIGVKPRRVDPLPARSMRFLRDAVAAAHAAVLPDPVLPAEKYVNGVEVIQYILAELLCALLGRSVAALAPGGPQPSTQAAALAQAQSAARAQRHGDGEVPLAAAAAAAQEPHSAGSSVLAGAAFAAAAATRPPTVEAGRSHRRAPMALAEAATRGVRAAREYACSLSGAITKAGRLSDAAPAPVRAMAVRAARPQVETAAAGAARAALALARREVRSTGAPLLAHSVDDDGLSAMRAAVVERSIQDARSDADGLGIKGASDALLRGLLQAAMRAIDRRFAAGTRRLDKSYVLEILGQALRQSRHAAAAYQHGGKHRRGHGAASTGSCHRAVGADGLRRRQPNVQSQQHD